MTFRNLLPGNVHRFHDYFFHYFGEARRIDDSELTWIFRSLLDGTFRSSSWEVHTQAGDLAIARRTTCNGCDGKGYVTNTTETDPTEHLCPLCDGRTD